MIAAQTRVERLRNADAARIALAEVAAPGSAMEEFLKIVGMDARSAVIRWGNVNRPIVLSSAVFDPDDDRAYRMKPNVRSVWAIGTSFQKSLGIFLIPDTPEALAAAARAGKLVVPESAQVTNRWGCRGPEPDANAPVRILVLGDSIMQGMLVGDDETPPARLQDRLAASLAAPVCVLNAGTIGYSPEQYFYTLDALGDRFCPHFVIVSICDNDFGGRNLPEAWSEGEYWLDQIAERCNQRGWRILLVPAPIEPTLLGKRDLSVFQGPVSRIFKRSGKEYVDPLESFTDALLAIKNDAARQGTATTSNPLYNVHLLNDRHFSPRGCDVWANVVARRLLLVWDSVALAGNSIPAPVAQHAKREQDQSDLPRDRP
jgi:lysophospholipase L1-like esterase